MKTISRRNFLDDSTKVVAVASTFPLYSFAENKKATAPIKMKLAMVGTGYRGTNTWGKSVIQAYKDQVEMVALCDINPKRMEAARSIMNINAKMYEAKDFDLMVQETKPDMVIVTTTDCFHEKYIIRALELGCNVLSEKPMAISAEQCQQIADAENRTGKKVFVGFNIRHANESIEMKKILSSGELGKIIAIEYQECLNTQHGADYYRRWHGKKKYSGSLLLHKACHQFDLINWLIDAEPVDVQAIGKLAYYGHNNSYRGRNCRTCAFTQKCKFYWDMAKDSIAMQMYGNCEDVDGYYRDGCVWDNEIDSYDTQSVQVNYDNGTQMSYTMNTFLPFEGQFICFSGEYGRLEVRLNAIQPWKVEGGIEFRLTKDTETSKYWILNASSGGHGGADERLKDMIFLPGTPDPLGSKAGSRAGIMSSLIGIAARKSIETGQKVKIADLVTFPSTWKG
ncbi:MAG: Gfo/Idh/MocA family oxidoreductase [Prolixibacteraceae bacterium]|nr:Gfo/Idh/MocA family oxidoreductase [Prolixibacteraceae bacterium]